MDQLNSRTEAHSRYAIFFIHSGNQVKNIVLNIILKAHQLQDTFIRDTRLHAGKVLSALTYDVDIYYIPTYYGNHQP